jgi:beta-glucosidase
VKTIALEGGREAPPPPRETPTAAGEPPKRLVAFDKVALNPGEKRRVQLTIDPAATNHPLSYWDETGSQWKIADGDYSVYVGSSAEALAASDVVKVSQPPRRGR